MLLVVPPAHTNIPLATTTQCCLFQYDFQPWLMLPLLVPRMVACRTTLTTIGKPWEDDEMQIVWAKRAVGFGALAMSQRASFVPHIPHIPPPLGHTVGTNQATMTTTTENPPSWRIQYRPREIY